MEVKLDKRYPLEVGVEQAWLVLSDIRATAACMPGAQITEQLDDTHFKGTVKSKVGPATMVFNGEIELLGRDAAARSLQLLGKGADKAGSSASMNLAAHLEAGATAATSVLVGQATIIVSGKLAQFGSRLLVPVSDAMLKQFADNFRSAAAAAGASVPPAIDGAAVPAAAAGAPASGTPAVAPAVRVAPPPAPVKELDALALMWSVIKSWVAGLFGRKR
jgi:uncharacterized protein